MKKNKEQKKEYMRNYMKDYYKNNLDKMREKNKKANKKRAEYFKDYNIKNKFKIKEIKDVYNKKYYQMRKFDKYGIDENIYNQMCINQNYKCLICLEQKKLYIDHDHETGEVRGLLCQKCNSALGFLNEDIETVANALQYLKNYQLTLN